MILNLSNADFARPDDRVCDDVCQQFHAGPITGLDICIRKPLIATCGKDRNIILWNYQTKSVECSKHFSAEILSISIHPSGLHLIAGFPDKLRFMNIYGDDIREFRSYNIRGCTECRFSNGGQFFAAATPAIIHVYETYTCEQIGHLKGHTGKVKSLFFVPPNDTRILSVGTDGILMEFDLTDFNKVQDNVIKVISYNAVSGDANTVWAAGNDRKLRQFERNHLQQLAEFDTRNAAITCMVQSPNTRLLYTGCEDGTLRVFNTYLAEKTAGERRHLDKSGPGHTDTSGNQSALRAQMDKMDIMVESHMGHQGPISRIAVSFDEELVVTTGEDGVVIIWYVSAPHKGTKKEFKFTEEILIDKRDLDERTRNITNLQNTLQELQQKKQHQSKKRQRKHEDTIHKLEQEYHEEKMRQDSQFFKLDSEIAEQKLKFGEDLRSLDQRHVHDTNRIDQEYNSKIIALKEQSHKLRHTVEEQIRDFNHESRDREKKWQDAIELEKRRQESEYADINSKIVKLIAEESKKKEEADTIYALIEEETESEIISLKEAFEKQRVTEETFISKLQSENATLLNDENNKKQDLNAKKAEIAEKLNQQASLDLQVEGLNRDIDALNSELMERSDTIKDKDKRIFELQNKNQELEKFKFVLEYKIKELKTQIDPRDEEIRQAHAKFADMEEESTYYLSSNEALVLQLRTLKQKLNVHVKEIEDMRPLLQEITEYQSRLWTELTNLYEEKDPVRLKDITKALYVRYANNDRGNGINAPSHAAMLKASQVLCSRTTEDAQREYSRQRDYLEGTLDGLKRKLVKDSEAARTEKARIINDNVTLIRQINDLRREVKTLNMSKRQMSLLGSDDDFQRELQIQRAEIHQLRAKADELERQIYAAKRVVSVARGP
eukprot:Tbor_TRINITY_DN2079_c0_g1::TRINITY_DN2079_c0_g1_i1::g.12107::m.12107